MVQIPEINVNDKESATLRILRSSGLKFQVTAEAGNGWLTDRLGAAIRCLVSAQFERYKDE